MIDPLREPEVTAQRMTAAFDAVDEILSLIHARRLALSVIPSGRALVERADLTRRNLSGTGLES